MIQTLELPLLSLAVPNINKLNDINADSLSCMWTVFSKCKDNLENGRRLENMSWRLWYRESNIKEAIKLPQQQQQQQQISPIPITPAASRLAEKALVPKSFTQMISTLNENEIIIRPQQQAHPHYPLQEIKCEEIPQQRQNKFFIDEDEWEDSDCSDDEGDVDDERVFSTSALTDKPSFHAVQHEEQDLSYESNDEDYETVDEDEDDECAPTISRNPFHTANSQSYQTTPCQLEFTKQIPSPNGNTRGFSLLSNMFRSQVAPDASNRLSINQ